MQSHSFRNHQISNTNYGQSSIRLYIPFCRMCLSSQSRMNILQRLQYPRFGKTGSNRNINVKHPDHFTGIFIEHPVQKANVPTPYVIHVLKFFFAL